jgi:hypothetical protein
MSDAARDSGYVEAHVTINLASCEPLSQLYLSTGYLEDWIVGTSMEEVLPAPHRRFENFYALAYFFVETVGCHTSTTGFRSSKSSNGFESNASFWIRRVSWT